MGVLCGLLACCVLLELWVSSDAQAWCAPKLFDARKWTLQITHTDQGPVIVQSISTMSFDFIGQRLASYETGTRNGQSYAAHFIYYYPAGVLYTVEDGACTASPLHGNMTAFCYDWSDSAHMIDYLNKEYIGDARDGSPIMGPMYYRDGVGSLLTFDIEGMIPLFTGNDGVIDGVPTYTVNTYQNVTLGISDPSVFTPPSSCVKPMMSSEPPRLPLPVFV